MTTPAPASDATTARYAPYGTPEVRYDDHTTHDGWAPTAFTADPATGTFPTGAYDTASWQTGAQQPHDPYATGQHTGYDTGTYETGTYDTGTYDTGAYGTGAYDTSAWTLPEQATGTDASGQWDSSAWQLPEQQAADATQQWDWGTQTFDTGTYDATRWNSGTAYDTHEAYAEQPYDPQATGTYDLHATGTFDTTSFDTTAFAEQPGYEGAPEGGYEGDRDEDAHDGELIDTADDLSGNTRELPAVAPLLDDQEETVPAARPATRSGSRARRRTPAKRSALLTIAVPSACVMGVAGVAVASVGDFSDDSADTAAAAPDGAHAVQPSVANGKLDAQLRTLSAGVDDFTDRASRTQERIDLKAQQELQQKKAAAEAALKERLRPKFVLPVAQHGLSAYFGQAGVNWMSVHTGIDFPVAYGTTVMAATDGTVRTQWNSAYGNMLILTAKDGTETWYCHLSSYRVPSGTVVKAGQPIAYSGNSGNSTGPHLHFEVRPGGGAAVDPLPWLRSHGLNPN